MSRPAPRTPRTASRTLLAGAAVATLAATAVAAGAQPARADVTGLQFSDPVLTWGCDALLPMNPAWELGWSEYSVGSLAGSVPAGGPYAVDVTSLPTGGYTANIQCVYVPGWDPSGGTHRTYGSLAVSHVAPVTAPSAPTSLGATPGDGQVALSWLPPASDGGAPVTYTVTAQPGGQQWTGLTATSHLVTGLPNTVPHTFTVVAVNSAGAGPAAGPVEATPVPVAAVLGLSVGPAGVEVGGQVTAEVTVEGAGAPVSGGTVRLELAATGAVVDVPVVAGTASAALALPAQAGEVVVTATYSGTPAAGPASTSTTYQVEAATPTLALVAPATVTTGVPFTLTASASGAHATPQGGVQLIAYAPGRAPVVRSTTLVDGVASAELPGLPVGDWTVLAHYSGSSTQGVYRQVDSAEHALRVTRAVVGLVSSSQVATAVGSPAALTVGVTGAARPATLAVLEGDAVLATVPVPESGDVVVVLPVLAPGSHDLVLATPGTDVLEPGTGAVRLLVTGTPVAVGGSPTGEVTTSAAPVPGATTTLTAGGFEPGETVVFALRTGDVLLGTDVAAADGTASVSWAVPATLLVGDHVVLAVGGASGRWSELAFAVAAPVAPASASVPGVARLARTGGDPTTLLVLQGLLVVGGAGLLLARRRLLG